VSNRGQQFCRAGFDIHPEERHGAEHSTQRDQKETDLLGEVVLLMQVQTFPRRGQVAASANGFGWEGSKGLHDISYSVYGKISHLFTLVYYLIR
jgi:hypothetical protein